MHMKTCILIFVTLNIKSCFSCSTCIQCSGIYAKSVEFAMPGSHLNEEYCFEVGIRKGLTGNGPKNPGSGQPVNSKVCPKLCISKISVQYDVDWKVEKLRQLKSKVIIIQRGCYNEYAKKKEFSHSNKWEKNGTSYVITNVIKCDGDNCNDNTLLDFVNTNNIENIAPTCRICEVHILHRNYNVDCLNKVKKIEKKICFGKCFNIHYSNKNKIIFKRKCIHDQISQYVNATGYLYLNGYWTFASCRAKMYITCNDDNVFIINYLKDNANKIQFQNISRGGHVCLICISTRRVNDTSTTCERGIVDTMFNVVKCYRKCATYAFYYDDMVQITRGCQGTLFYDDINKTPRKVPSMHRSFRNCRGCKTKYVLHMLSGGYDSLTSIHSVTSIEECKLMCNFKGKSNCNSFEYNEQNKFCNFIVPGSWEDNLNSMPGSSKKLHIYKAVDDGKDQCILYCFNFCNSSSKICNDKLLSELNDMWRIATIARMQYIRRKINKLPYYTIIKDNKTSNEEINPFIMQLDNRKLPNEEDNHIGDTRLFEQNPSKYNFKMPNGRASLGETVISCAIECSNKRRSSLPGALKFEDMHSIGSWQDRFKNRRRIEYSSDSSGQLKKMQMKRKINPVEPPLIKKKIPIRAYKPVSRWESIKFWMETTTSTIFTGLQVYVVMNALFTSEEVKNPAFIPGKVINISLPSAVTPHPISNKTTTLDPSDEYNFDIYYEKDDTKVEISKNTPKTGEVSFGSIKSDTNENYSRIAVIVGIFGSVVFVLYSYFFAKGDSSGISHDSLANVIINDDLDQREGSMHSEKTDFKSNTNSIISNK